jgi:hypothetical protein
VTCGRDEPVQERTLVVTRDSVVTVEIDPDADAVWRAAYAYSAALSTADRLRLRHTAVASVGTGGQATSTFLDGPQRLVQDALPDGRHRLVFARAPSGYVMLSVRLLGTGPAEPETPATAAAGPYPMSENPSVVVLTSDQPALCAVSCRAWPPSWRGGSAHRAMGSRARRCTR